MAESRTIKENKGMDRKQTDEVVAAISNGLKAISGAITPAAVGSHDAAGGYVESLTEAVMGTTRGLCEMAKALELIADALDGVASAIEAHANNTRD